MRHPICSPKLVEIATTALRPEGFFENNLDIGDIFCVPHGNQETVGKAHDQLHGTTNGYSGADSQAEERDERHCT
jgi:hypothetical protein